MVQSTASVKDSVVRFFFRAICAPPKPSAKENPETYFRWRLAQAERFFGRFGGRLDIREKSILDFGCGHGSMSVFLARNGARRVVGIDTDHERIEFARNKLKSEFSSLQDKVEYLSAAELPPRSALISFSPRIASNTMKILSVS